MKKLVRLGALVMGSAIGIPQASACGHDAPVKIAEGKGSWKIPGIEEIKRMEGLHTNVHGAFDAEFHVFTNPILVRTGSLEEITPELAKRIADPEDVITITRMTIYSVRQRPYAYVSELRITRFVPPGWKPPVAKLRKDGLPEPALGGVVGCVTSQQPFQLNPFADHGTMIPLSIAFIDTDGDGIIDEVSKTDSVIKTPAWVTALGGESPFETSGSRYNGNAFPVRLPSPLLPKLAKP